MKAVAFMIVLFMFASPFILLYGFYRMFKDKTNPKTEEEQETEQKEQEIRMSSELWKVVMILAAFGCIAIWDY